MKHQPIQFLRTNFLRGPSIWTYRPAVEVLIDLGELEDYPSNKLPGFVDRLLTWLPSLIEHTCSPGYRGGFVERLRTGTWPGHIMEHVALELQNLAGMTGTFGKAREMDRRGIYKVVIGTRQEEVGRRAIADARDLVMAAINDEPFDVAASVQGLRELIDRHALGPSTASIVEAAYERRIPAIRLTDGNLVQLGYGAKQRRIWTAETDRTSAIAEGISRDKDLTKELLKACGIPIPEGRVVANPEDAWEAAQEIGLPVVVKPSDGNHGRGVVLELKTREAVEAAFRVAEPEGSQVIVERCIPGQEHRLLIVGGRLVAAARGEEAHIVGDGASTVMELIESQINANPNRGVEQEFPLDTIRLPQNGTVMLELQRQGVTPESVPQAGRRLLVQRTGVMTQDITDEVHPDVAAIGALAARVVGLDIAGIDLVATDISLPLEEQGGAIVEVNAGPGLLMHLKPAVGNPRPVGEAILNHLFGTDEDGYIPIAGVSGGEHTTAVARLLAQLLYRAGHVTGLACSEGMYIQMDRIEALGAGDWEAGQRILMNRTATAAVVESTARSILENGLAYDRCQVGVVTSVPAPQGLEDHLILTQDHMRNVLRTQVDVVLPRGCAVLNADDEVCASMGELCDGAVLYYSTEPDHPLRESHCAAGGRFLVVRDQKIVQACGATQTVVLDLRKPAVVRRMQRGTPLPAMLAAVGAALALDLTPALIRACVENDE
jgi:cyanophycin synthetase